MNADEEMFVIGLQGIQGEICDVGEVETYIRQYLKSLELEFSLTGLELINAMITAHLSRYSFSSVNVILNKPISLNKEVLFARVINQKSGGYCFEHNKIFYLALSALGFEVRPLIARVMLNGDPDTGRLHRLTLLDFENEQYIIDVGFGAENPTTIIKLPTHCDANKATVSAEASIQNYQTEQYKAEPHQVDKYEVVQYQVDQEFQNSFLIKKVEGESITTLYRVDLAEYTEFDCNIGHFYSHQSPQAIFVNHLVVSRIENNKKFLLKHLTYSEFNTLESSESSREIADANELCGLLNNTFFISVTLVEADKLFKHQMMKSGDI